MDSLTVGNLEGEWKDKFLGHMKSADFFDVAKFPTATLKLSRIKKGTASGELTKHHPADYLAGKYVGKATFDRTKFGIIYGSGSFFKNLGDKLINDQIDVIFSIRNRGLIPIAATTPTPGP